MELHIGDSFVGCLHNLVERISNHAADSQLHQARRGSLSHFWLVVNVIKVFGPNLENLNLPVS